MLHQCDNPPCVNPDHLFLGNNSLNSADKCLKGRQSKGSQIGNSKLNENKVFRARLLYKLGVYNFSQLAKIYGVSIQIMTLAVRGKSWAHVPMCPD